MGGATNEQGVLRMLHGGLAVAGVMTRGWEGWSARARAARARGRSCRPRVRAAGRRSSPPP
ncbi:hypothetical protein FHT26_001157 [Rhizobacter sp. SG703]|nr:hypothetical protein [Rhizobacter sp. SG703]